MYISIPFIVLFAIVGLVYTVRLYGLTRHNNLMQDRIVQMTKRNDALINENVKLKMDHIKQELEAENLDVIGRIVPGSPLSDATETELRQRTNREYKRRFETPEEFDRRLNNRN